MISSLRESRWLTPLARFTATFFTFACIPPSLYAYDPSKPREVNPPAPSTVLSRELTESEMESLSGRTGNPYNAGQAKFDIVFQGINTRTLNFTTAGSDLSFEGGYGIPVAVTRSYSANNIDEGPLGPGWTISTDIRSSAGGLLKSPKAPDRSVPVDIRRRPTTEIDPNRSTQPVEAVTVTDSGGSQSTIQRDVDGVLTTAPWEKNQYEAEYEPVTQSGNTYWVMTENKTITPDGTTYHYIKTGEYLNGGSRPWNNNSATPEPNNVLKPDWVTDRQGNTTRFSYGASPVQFTKNNGVTSELPLVKVEMPNGRFINLNWSGNRLISATDNERSVSYSYTNGRLSMVTSPGGKKTRFEYDPSTGAINKIIDPQGNVTQLFHWIRSSDGAIQTGRIELPDGNGYRFDCSPEFSQNLQRTSPVFSGPSNDSGGRNIHLFPPNVASVGEESYSDIYYQFGSNSIMVVELAPPPGFGQSERKKIYNYENYDLVEESLYFFHYATITNPNSGDLGARDITIKQTGYNFLGNKLEETTKTKRVNYYGQDIEPERVIRTSTAYWGPEKYYQQKAVRVKAGNVTRYSFTDYYPSNAQAGQRGQASLVYDQKYGGITLNTLVALPAWSTPETAWRYQVSVSDPAKFSGSFDYDGQGRPIQVKKLQKVVNGIYHYVQTDSTYGAPGAPTYGGATQVIEDVGGANRLTQTLAFDVAGRSIDTVDGQGRRFVTDYDPDGAIQTITHANAIPPVVIASFDYGTADGTPENGQVLQVTDGLSGTRQTASYIQTGPARGKPHIIFEDLGLGQQTTVEATYNSLGDRILSRVTTPNGTKVTKYKNWTYTSNFAIDKQRLFTRINQQRNVDSNWVDSEEEVRYSFDFMGRLVTVDFAMTPQGGAQDYTVDSPLSFVRARYGYDAGGRITSVDHTWNQLAGSNYAKSAILGTSAEYNSPLALKTATKFWNPNGTNFILHRTESYGYDPDLDYLTSVNYGDGSPQEVWTYDAAGNRASSSATPGAWSYDNLNRMTTSPGSIYTHSAIGNRLSKTTGGQTTTYGWDTLNRLTSISSPSGTTTYQYRADGMRLRKTTSGVTESFYYEGQMPIESAKSGVITRNFLGGRGIEAITTITNTGSNTVYPVYDTHGNMIATVSKGFNGMSWASGNIRTYDVWGGVRAGAPTGGPANRYCANLGHLQDDESGLIYMRARYYEPSSGRFISEDPARDGGNWFRYADNIPSIKIDKTGRVAALAILGLVMLFLAPLVEEGFQQFRYGIWSPERLGVAALHGLLAMVGGAIALAWIAGLGVTAVLSAGSLAPGIFGVLVVVALMFLAYEVFLLIAFADWKDDICELKENATR